ncbi:hypothetical protein [Streptomyces lincolnensis]|uniref:hypothetical protein n=1 Tax=Streptomyces lincolnensis TaxID=1915 RepID=UPI0037CFE01F
MLGLGLLLFGLLYAHAVSPDATVSHVNSGKAVPVSDVLIEPTAEPERVASVTQAVSAGDSSEGHHPGHGEHLTSGECALGQPSQGPGVGMPSLWPLSTATDDSMAVPVHARPSAARDFAVPLAHHAAETAVLRI